MMDKRVGYVSKKEGKLRKYLKYNVLFVLIVPKLCMEDNRHTCRYLNVLL